MAVRILIVENDPLYVMQLRMCIDTLGYETLGPVATAAEGERLFLEETPDLVLLDVHLDGPEDGIALAERLRRHRPDVPLLFVTVFTDRATFERARPVGPLAFLTKPFLVPTVQNAIELALQQARPAPAESAPSGEEKTAEPDEAAAWREDLLVRNAFFVKQRDRIVKIPQTEVLAIEAVRGYSLLHTARGEQLLLSMTLLRLEEHLDDTGFVRASRAWLVNASRVEELLLSQNLVRVGPLLVPISAPNRTELLRRVRLLS